MSVELIRELAASVGRDKLMTAYADWLASVRVAASAASAAPASPATPKSSKPAGPNPAKAVPASVSEASAAETVSDAPGAPKKGRKPSTPENLSPQEMEVWLAKKAKRSETQRRYREKKAGNSQEVQPESQEIDVTGVEAELIF